MTSIFALSGINYEKFIKKNKIYETRFLVILLSLALGYLVGSFIIAFIET
jgi:uncharacterized integral membrane protein (TIGR02327 family)